MEFKGTKGEWELDDKGRKIIVRIRPNEYKQIFYSYGSTKWQYDMVLAKNAPEMLEMLNFLRPTFKGTQTGIEIEQLIQKATTI